MMSRKILVTGCARSGTMYMATLLRAAGVRVGHEYVMEDGTVSWYFGADGSLGLAPGRKRHANGERRSHYEWRRVWHQLRHPLKVIPSAAAVLRGRDWEYACGFTGAEPREIPKMARAARYWLFWNQLIQSTKPTWTYRVEDVRELWPFMAQELGVSPKEPMPEVSSMTNHASPSRGLRRIATWDELATEVDNDMLMTRIVDYAKVLGYTEEL